MPPEQTESSPVASDAKPADAVADTSAASAPPAAPPDASAESSTAPQDAKDERQALLDAVKAAVEPQTPAQDSSTAKPEAKAEEQADLNAAKPEGDKPAEGEQQDDSKLPFHNHPRWKQVIAERDQYRQGAEQFDKIASFMESNGLSNQEVVDGFRVMALMKADPARALEELERFAAPLREFVGQVLPADLQAKVDQGHLDADSARELAAARNQAKHASERAAAVSESARAERQRTEAQTAEAQMFDAVAKWEADTKASDPDYAVKQSFVVDRIRVLKTANPPRNAQEAVALAKQAHEDVTKQLRQLAPRTREQKSLPGPNAIDTSPVRGAPQPRSLLEAAQRAVQQGA